MVARLFGRELAGFDHVGHQTVVARELLEFPLVKQVGARVADLRDKQALVLEHAGGHGGAHAVAAATVVRSADDFAIRLFDGVLEHGSVKIFRGEFRQHVHGDFRCHFARCVATHAVGDGEQRRRDN